ncbi:MAG: isoprenylcysteine carboxylmethyltransferase family protein [Chitinophagaceae bacterium]
MQGVLCWSFIFFVVLRLLTVFISARNEKKLKKLGAVEYGKTNSTILIIAHFGFYIACLTEGLGGPMFSTTVGVAGFWIYVFSVLMLYYVIYTIRHVWTVKLLIAPALYHTINRNFIFRVVKHPNYFLNIIPELVGIALVFQAWYTLIIGLPLYLISLFIRIKQEEKIMKEKFRDY